MAPADGARADKEGAFRCDTGLVVIRTATSLALAFALFVASAGAACAATPPARWLLVSDLHFDPFGDPALPGALVQAPAGAWHAIFEKSAAAPSGYFHDTNFALLESALAEMRAQVPAAPVVVVAGDFLAHGFPAKFAAAEPGASPAVYDAFVDKTIAFLAGELGAAFPQAQFIVTLGNNDGYCDDYAGTAASPFLARMAAAFEPLVDRGGRAPGFLRDFSRNGYYVTTLPGAPGAQAIVLDSVYWSAKYDKPCGGAGGDPGAAELDWLAATISAPAPAYRWFVTHIPPAMDPYSSLVANRPVPFMREAYAGRLRALATAAHPSAFLFGHVHHPSFEIVGPGDGTGVPGLILPSISAVQGNDPAFVAADVAPSTGVLTDFTTYALALGTPGAAWQREYDFDAAYGTAAFDTPDLDVLQIRLASDPALWARYAAYFNSGSAVATIAPGTWPWYWCGAFELAAAPYAACVANLVPARSSEPKP